MMSRGSVFYRHSAETELAK